jgi:hypothetical protein
MVKSILVGLILRKYRTKNHIHHTKNAAIISTFYYCKEHRNNSINYAKRQKCG